MILPIGSSVLYAELVWGGLYKSQTQDISAVIDNAVTLNINNQNFSITPDEITKQTFSIPSAGFDVGFYVRTVINNPVIRRVYNIYFCCCRCGNKRDRTCYHFCGRCPHMYRCKCINITKRAICRKKRFCKYCRNRFLVD